jgi:hypothetical protein
VHIRCVEEDVRGWDNYLFHGSSNDTVMNCEACNFGNIVIPPNIDVF